jgi:hypothetical protein
LIQVALVVISTASVFVAGYFVIETGIVFPPNAISRSHPEVLTMDSFSIASDSGQPNPTVLTMVIRNVGAVTVTIVTLTIQDQTDQSSSPAFSLNGPTIPAPNFSSTVTVDTLNSGFHFIHRHTYTFNVNTKQTHVTFGPVAYA